MLLLCPATAVMDPQRTISLIVAMMACRRRQVDGEGLRHGTCGCPHPMAMTTREDIDVSGGKTKPNESTD